MNKNQVNELLEQKEYALDLFKNKSLPSTAKQDKNQVIENIDRIRLRVIKVIWFQKHEIRRNVGGKNHRNRPPTHPHT